MREEYNRVLSTPTEADSILAAIPIYWQNPNFSLSLNTIHSTNVFREGSSFRPASARCEVPSGSNSWNVNGKCQKCEADAQEY